MELRSGWQGDPQQPGNTDEFIFMCVPEIPIETAFDILHGPAWTALVTLQEPMAWFRGIATIVPYHLSARFSLPGRGMRLTRQSRGDACRCGAGCWRGKRGKIYQFIISLCPTELQVSQRAAFRCQQFHSHEDQEMPLVPETPLSISPGG